MQIPSTLAIKILIGAAALSIAFYSGWRTKSAFVAEAELASVKEENKITEEFRKFEASVSDKLELKLQELKANERVIERRKTQSRTKTILLFTMLSALMLQGCFLSNKREWVKPIQSNLLSECPELSVYEGTTGSMALANVIRWANEYNVCKEKHNSLVKVLKKELN